LIHDKKGVKETKKGFGEKKDWQERMEMRRHQSEITSPAC
jgi:hypothetical protein